MSREWKPGDVAMWTTGDRSEVIYRYMGGHEFDLSEWMTAHDGGGYPLDRDLRPLVVIDPEDREQVDRLAKLYVAQWGPDGRSDVITPDLQQALRSLVEPPKLEEPTDPATRAYCDVAGERTEWARVPGRADDLPGTHPVWVNGWGGRRTWKELIEAYDVEVVTP